ncbi:hypothetical protein [Pseudorhodoferax sp. Leaf267]|uniref:hypothetical protein n=1 Tax=Pseudorhodoferax sp. Leaf267 TaxID=1736316 RepID=UPI0006FBE662|nr:hypothetical protein [Pseudorhodoferax sp. Leaf267]KQP20565.1 hypothetical protein ASF43_27460 [Pseudorhodoferax sp. Leaf267]
MSLTLLKRLATSALPYRTTEQSEMLHIAVLRASKLVEADLPPMKDHLYVGEAVVYSITKNGRALATVSQRRG